MPRDAEEPRRDASDAVSARALPAPGDHPGSAPGGHPGSAPEPAPGRATRRAPGGATGPPDGDADDEHLIERDRATSSRLAVSPLGRGASTRPLAVAALVVVVFMVSLARPWDWLPSSGRGDATPGEAGVPASPAGRPAAGGSSAATAGSDGSDGAWGGASEAAGVGDEPRAPACGYPQDWRSAAIQIWAGRRAHVWTAVPAVRATGPADPSIPFEPVASVLVEAIGWCAPIGGPDRPPRDAVGTLFLIEGGVATAVPFVRLEPTTHDALGELWVPIAGAVPGSSGDAGAVPGSSGDAGAVPGSSGDAGAVRWPDGRYVIRLATPDGTYARYLGLEVRPPLEPAPRPTSAVRPSSSASHPSPAAAP
jgi:hypothetical protein